MMRYLFVFSLAFFFLSCDKQEVGSRSADQENLVLLYERIIQQADAPCSDPEDWEFVAVGEKACGGPKGYVAYPKSIDTKAFLKLVEAYNTADKAFNIKYGVASDCMYLMPPKGIVCEDGKVRLVYGNE